MNKNQPAIEIYLHFSDEWEKYERFIYSGIIQPYRVLRRFRWKARISRILSGA